MNLETNQINLANLISDELNLDLSMVKDKLDIIVNKITLELSKGNLVHYPRLIKLQPAIREPGVNTSTSLGMPKVDFEYIYPRVTVHKAFYASVRNYKLNNLDLL